MQRKNKYAKDLGFLALPVVLVSLLSTNSSQAEAFKNTRSTYSAFNEC